MFNDKHHSTVMYSVDKISQLKESDPDLAQALTTMQQHFA
jgi:chromosomal replication initiation ATPase DnaA